MILTANRVLMMSSIIFMLLSCDRPKCNNSNVVFDENEPQSEIYKKELAKQINILGSENLRYWLKSYEKEDFVEYMLIYVQNDSLCAIMQLNVHKWDKKIKHIQERKGVGRRGAELDGLKFTTINRNDSVSFVYKYLTRIID